MEGLPRGQTQRHIPGAPILAEGECGGDGSRVLLRSHAGTWGTGPGLCWHPPPGVPGPACTPGYSLSPQLRAHLCCSLTYLEESCLSVLPWILSLFTHTHTHTHTHTRKIAPRHMHTLGQIVPLDAHIHSCEHLRGDSVSRSPHHQSPCPEQVSVTAVE